MMNDDMEEWRRRLRFRAWRRGIKEMDLIMGTFADHHVFDMNECDLSIFEILLDTPDDELFTWITGRAAIPDTHQSPLLDRLCRIRLDMTHSSAVT